MSNKKTRALLVKMSSLGDLVHSFAAVSDAKRVFGDELELDWLVDEQYAQVPTWHEGVSQVVPIALRRWRKNPGLKAAGELMSYLLSLRSKRYDVVIDAQGLLKSALLGVLPVRGNSHGYAHSCVREKVASVFYGTTHLIKTNQHAIERTRHLFAHSLGYEKPTSKPDYGIKQGVRPKKKTKKLVLITCCARSEKCWSDAKWVSLAKQASDAGYTVELTWGTQTERKQASRLAAAAKIKLAPELALEDVPPYLAKASAVVSLDTGLSHIAAAWGTPNVCLCITTDPKLSGALGKNQIALASANELEADEVWDRVQQLLKAKVTQKVPASKHKAKKHE